MENKRTELVEQPMIKLMFKLSLPAIFGMLVIGLYSFVDAIFVGQWVGESALGAISIAYPFTLINNGIAVLVGIGSASVLSRAIGRKDIMTRDKIMGNLFMLSLILSVLVMVRGFIFARQLLMLTGAEGDMLELAVIYLKTIYLGSIFVNFAQSANMVIRGEGKMMIAMVIMAIGAILNIILDPIFIKVLDMGINGAAIATVIAQIIQAIITFIYFAKYSQVVKFNQFKLDMEIVPEVASVGVSAMLMQVLSLIQQTVTYSTLKSTSGESAVIIMSALMRYMMLSFIPIWGISQGFQPVAGTNYGAKRYDRVKSATKVFTVGALCLGLVFWLPLMWMPKTIMSWFITNPDTINAGITSVRIAYAIFPISGFIIIVITLFQSVGDAKKAGLLVMARQVFLFVPLVLILPKLFGLKHQGVFVAFVLTDAIIAVISVALVRKLFKQLRE